MDYLDWQSSVSLDQVFADVGSFSHPSILDSDRSLYLSKCKQDNRSIINVIEADGAHLEITPAPFSLQTRVNEYGGKPYWLFGSSLVFANKVDQCLYSQNFSGSEVSAPKRISPKPSDDKRFMYTDLHQIGYSNTLAIIELECVDQHHSNNKMFIGFLGSDSELEPVSLVEGADFYSNLVVNHALTKAAWVQWNHPNMPWDDTQLWVADISWNGPVPCLTKSHEVQVSNDGVGGASICQLIFSNNDRLFFSADYVSPDDKSGSSTNASYKQSVDADMGCHDVHNGENYWNVHAYNLDNQTVTTVTSDSYEYGYPHWVYGDHRIVQINDTSLLTIASAPSGDELVLIDQETLACKRLSIESDDCTADRCAGTTNRGAGTTDRWACTIEHLDSIGKNACVFVKRPFSANPSLVQLEYSECDQSVVLKTLIDAAEHSADVSSAVAITFETRDAEQAHGFYYPPVNHTQAKLTYDDALPPLLVMVHGGPTARAYGHFDLQKQFWTSRGFAILDVNHRGSSGYGRRFRDSLYGHWGERDTSDIVDAIKHLIDLGKVDPNRVCIRGKSAGGYAVLRALTEYPQLFRVGACYYGIGNLVTLAETTHKFEKHYTDRLIDEVFDVTSATRPNSKFYQRSPINRVNQLKSSMIVFQGALDRVVPPSVAKEITDALAESRIHHEYVEYSNEGHGFRLPENNIDAWQKELKFYRQVLRD